MAKERVMLSLPKKADEVLKEIAENLDVSKGKAAEAAILDYSKKVLKD